MHLPCFIIIIIIIIILVIIIIIIIIIYFHYLIARIYLNCRLQDVTVLDENVWKFVSIDYGVQTDGQSCGVFVLKVRKIYLFIYLFVYLFNYLVIIFNLFIFLFVIISLIMLLLLYIVCERSASLCHHLVLYIHIWISIFVTQGSNKVNFPKILQARFGIVLKVNSY